MIERTIFRNSDGQWIKYDGWLYEVKLHDDALQGMDSLRVQLSPTDLGEIPAHRLLLYSLHRRDRLGNALMLGHADTNPHHPETWRYRR